MAYIGIFPTLWANIGMKYSPHMYKTIYVRICLHGTFPST